MVQKGNSVTEGRGEQREKTLRIQSLPILGVFPRLLVEEGRDDDDRKSPYSCEPVKDDISVSHYPQHNPPHS